MLRRACQQGILTGWNGPHVTGGSYTVYPAKGEAGEWSADRVREYVVTLEAAGYRPLYRESEPIT